MRRAPLLGAAALAAAGLAWSVLRPAPERPSEPRAAGASVLLVTIDTLRADRVGAWGGPAGLTPRLDALAAGGVVFEEALSSTPLTLPSHATILSGLEPPHHGVRDNGAHVFPAGLPTLATRLQERGYAAGAFVGAYVLDRRFGLARGFEVYDDHVLRNEQGASVLESERRAEDVVTPAVAWISARSGAFFAWVHLYDPHAPYAAPEPWAGRHPGKPYDAEVAYTDAMVGRLVDAARQRAGGNLVVVVVADHGESLGEHGEATHGFFVYQSTLRIPFLLSAPGVAPRRSDRRARTVDVTPTVLALVGAPALAGADGADLLGPATTRESYAETHYPASLGWSPLHSWRLGDLKLVDAPRPELYDLGADPGETRDLFAERGRDARPLQEALARFRASERQATAPADPEVAERLRALGYVAAPPAREAGAAADPKDKLALWQAFEEATWTQARGDHAAAVPRLRALLVQEPGNAAFRRALSASLRRLGRAAEASEVLAAVESGDALAAHEQAVALAAAGRLDDAIRAAQRAGLLDPGQPEVQNHLGVLLARRGRLPEALAAFERATTLDPNNARAWTNRANALRARGRAGEAADAYRTAARLDPRDADAANGLAVLAVEAGDPAGAERLLREVLARQPGHADARLNLAVALHAQGRVGEARAELQRVLAASPDPEVGSRAAAFLRDLSGS